MRTLKEGLLWLREWTSFLAVERDDLFEYMHESDPQIYEDR